MTKQMNTRYFLIIFNYSYNYFFYRFPCQILSTAFQAFTFRFFSLYSLSRESPGLNYFRFFCRRPNWLVPTFMNGYNKNFMNNTKENCPGKTFIVCIVFHEAVMRFTERCFWRKNSTKRVWQPGTLPLDPSCCYSYLGTTYSTLKFQVLHKTKVDLKSWISPCFPDYLIIFIPPLLKTLSSLIFQDCK